MARKLYKYLGPELAGIALSHDGATLKFSLPREFNDPFELFLTVDRNSSPDTLAFYEEVIGEIAGMPTTCFSSHPDVVPMWAHYGQNGRGFVLEVDEDLLSADLRDDGVIEDVTYRDSSPDELAGLLARAQFRQKPRDIYFLRNGVYNAAYFTKATCWSYEKERRLVLNGATDLLQAGGVSVLPIPRQFVTAVILGSNVDTDTESKLRSYAAEIGCKVYKCRIGRSSITPYFTNSDGSTCVFAGGAISEAENSCQSCGEPMEDGDSCSWCRIQEADRHDAAASNSWRLIASAGLLQDYINSMNSIGKK
ncbi:DUF2971 domain-containing protein [Microbacterium oxydans]|uniref:DUF2971 domain-containing protein n=1 Tax=Microbacterium oxydans TaxID=82380 RepID=UPI000B84AB48|nr:DUF2971 domain-containing protein [Microbacterium oxydans]